MIQWLQHIGLESASKTSLADSNFQRKRKMDPFNLVKDDLSKFTNVLILSKNTRVLFTTTSKKPNNNKEFNSIV